MERKQRNAFVACKLGDQGVQLADLRFRARPTVVPRQHVGDGDAQPELLDAPNHGAQIGARLVDGPLLRDVVDAALDDERVGPGHALLESSHDLIGALPVDAAVAKFEPGLGLRRPVFPLARLVTPKA